MTEKEYTELSAKYGEDIAKTLRKTANTTAADRYGEDVAKLLSQKVKGDEEIEAILKAYDEKKAAADKVSKKRYEDLKREVRM